METHMQPICNTMTKLSIVEMVRSGTYFTLFMLVWLATACYALAQERTNQPDTLPGVSVYGDPVERAIRLDYGLNIGAYMADKSTANYYNGSGQYTGVGNQGTLEQIIGSSNNLNYTRIRQDIGYDYEIHGLPSEMRYNPAMMVGLFATLHLGQRVAVVVESNFMSLKTQDQYTIELARHSNIEGDNIERYMISGTEERIDIRIGLKYTFVSETSYIHPFVETGFIATDTKAKNNTARIGNSTYNIYFSGTSQYYPERDFGMGIGTYATLGATMDVSESFSFDIGFSGHYNKINLGRNDDFGMQYSLFVRLKLNELLSRTE
jgi:hypothetical protein